MKRATVALAGLLLTVLAPGAWALGKGGSMFAIELTHGIASVADSSQGRLNAAGASGFLSSYDHSEVGVQGQYWYMMADDYAVAVSAGIGFFTETDEQGSKGAPVGGADMKFSLSSFNLRLGGDRVAKVGDRAIVYGGPGLEFWSGKAKFENFPVLGPREYEGENTTRIGLSARLGGIMMLGEYVGLTGHIGGRYGYASVEEQGAKATWWPSSVEAATGLVYMFGGE